MSESINLVLGLMLGIPDELQCPRCGLHGASLFNDYDLDGSDFVGKSLLDDGPSHWQLRWVCPNCEKEFRYKFTLQIVGGSLEEEVAR